jgi:hypothetical protein
MFGLNLAVIGVGSGTKDLSQFLHCKKVRVLLLCRLQPSYSECRLTGQLACWDARQIPTIQKELLHDLCPGIT